MLRAIVRTKLFKVVSRTKQEIVFGSWTTKNSLKAKVRGDKQVLSLQSYMINGVMTVSSGSPS